jgi:hypothetical protein
LLGDGLVRQALIGQQQEPTPKRNFLIPAYTDQLSPHLLKRRRLAGSSGSANIHREVRRSQDKF